MLIPGTSLHRQLITAYNDAAANLDSIRGNFGEIESRRDELEANRDKSLSDLARHYLPSLTAESISQTWADVRPSIREVLLRKQNEARKLNEDLEADNVLRRGQEEALFAINEAIEAAQNDQTRIALDVENELQTMPEFVRLSDRAGVAEAALERAEANLNEVSQDAARKLPAFDSCKLFSYLKERGFGTKAYTHRGFTRRMDRMIAGMVDYTQSSRNYEFLKTTPETMRRIIAEDREALDTVMDELHRHRDDVAKAHGLPDKIQEVARLQTERQKQIADLDQTTSRCEATQAQLNELESPSCRYYAEAIELFRGMLSRLDTDDLRREARKTPSITDDQIVATLRGIDDQIDETELAVSERDEHLANGQAIHAAVGRLIQRFRASGFDVARCQFSVTLDVAGELARVRNPDDVEEVWTAIRRAQNWGPTAIDKVTAVATHPMTQVLVNAMAHAAAGALSEQARRAGGRRRRRF